MVGRFAAKAIDSELLRPHLVLLGAAGVSFDEPGGSLTYHFEDELDPQTAYATCRTDHRVLVCDHSKLGCAQRWRGCSVTALLEHTPRCTILTSCPAPGVPENELIQFERPKSSFRGLLERLEKVPAGASSATLTLRVIRANGEVEEDIPAR